MSYTIEEKFHALCNITYSVTKNASFRPPLQSLPSLDRLKLLIEWQEKRYTSLDEAAILLHNPLNERPTTLQEMLRYKVCDNTGTEGQSILQELDKCYIERSFAIGFLKTYDIKPFAAKVLQIVNSKSEGALMQEYLNPTDDACECSML